MRGLKNSLQIYPGHDKMIAGLFVIIVCKCVREKGCLQKAKTVGGGGNSLKIKKNFVNHKNIGLRLGDLASWAGCTQGS